MTPKFGAEKKSEHKSNMIARATIEITNQSEHVSAISGDRDEC